MSNLNVLWIWKCLISLYLLGVVCVLKKVDALGGGVDTDDHYLTLQTNSFFPSSICNPSPQGPTGKASLKIVHKHGPCSHLHQDGANAPTLSKILALDQSRVDSIQSRVSFAKGIKDSKTTISTNSGASLGTGNYIVTVGLGTPKKDISLAIDTGSVLTWTQCEPCDTSCYEQQQPYFDPSLSTSYSNIECTDPLCSDLTTATGNNPDCEESTCTYYIRYGDQSFTSGNFGKEKLTLSPTDVVDGFLFGCGENNQGLFGETAGILGLGRDKLSLLSQNAQKYENYFSYCLPSSSQSTGYLTFGKDGASNNNVQYTPFASSGGGPFYFIDVLDIYVGDTKLSISPTVFSNAGTIIDSGTVITRLPLAAYSRLSTEFQNQMAQYPMAPPASILDTCYDFSSYSTITYPKISFLFGGDVKVDLEGSGVFIVASPSQVCLAFAGNSDESDLGILGNVQQRGLQVVYDVAGEKLGFGSSGCD